MPDSYNKFGYAIDECCDPRARERALVSMQPPGASAKKPMKQGVFCKLAVPNKLGARR